MAIEDRGFASMDRNRQREIASKGGRAAHKKGAAHEWTREEAQAAGRKGGLARHKRPEEIVVPASRATTAETVQRAIVSPSFTSQAGRR